MSGKLLMIPTVIAENTQEVSISQGAKNAILACDFFFVENLRTARRYISSLKLGLTIEDLTFEILDKKTSFEDCFELIQPLMEGKTAGVISESGCPGVADPGAKLVHMAHQFGVQVIPYVGPSSILMALMASGFNGQSFTFHGYLPIDKKARQQSIRSLEKESFEKNRTQIFMDTPYRNEQLLRDILKTARKDTFLCIAKDITGKNEHILTKPVGKWSVGDMTLQKSPTIFLIYSQ
ncbi:MAG: SAM-dependent methyltransferase [Roseivirga sp.]|nr:SAM-dependent methyltransferase [Roseivirga sp.]